MKPKEIVLELRVSAKNMTTLLAHHPEKGVCIEFQQLMIPISKLIAKMTEIETTMIRSYDPYDVS